MLPFAFNKSNPVNNFRRQDGKFYRISCILQAWPHPITSDSDRCSHIYRISGSKKLCEMGRWLLHVLIGAREHRLPGKRAKDYKKWWDIFRLLSFVVFVIIVYVKVKFIEKPNKFLCTPSNLELFIINLILWLLFATYTYLARLYDDVVL